MRACLVIFNGPFVRGHWEATAWFSLKPSVCVCTCWLSLTYHSLYHCAAVCVYVYVCRQSAVIQAYLQPCGRTADCFLKVRTPDLWGLGQISVLGCCCLSLSLSFSLSLSLSLSHKHLNVHTRQLHLDTPLRKETLLAQILNVDTHTRSLILIYGITHILIYWSCTVWCVEWQSEMSRTNAHRTWFTNFTSFRKACGAMTVI